MWENLEQALHKEEHPKCQYTYEKVLKAHHYLQNGYSINGISNIEEKKQHNWNSHLETEEVLIGTIILKSKLAKSIKTKILFSL